MGSGQVHTGEIAAQPLGFLDEVDPVAGVGQFEGCGEAGDASAQHQGFGAHVGGQGIEGLLLNDAVDRTVGQGLGLFGCRNSVGVHPTALLANVGQLTKVRVETPSLAGAAECLLVHARAAGGDDHSVKAKIADILRDHFLSRVRAHVAIGAGDPDSGEAGHEILNRCRVNHVVDVRAATADVHPDFELFRVWHGQAGMRMGSGENSGTRRLASASAWTAARYIASGRNAKWESLLKGIWMGSNGTTSIIWTR